ncbi:hypothetical protein J6590_010299 [Homalodisca vitripennis]|nr:hypothetical protein J6590_010299 [Homalodisca vitripennis]
MSASSEQIKGYVTAINRIRGSVKLHKDRDISSVLPKTWKKSVAAELSEGYAIEADTSYALPKRWKKSVAAELSEGYAIEADTSYALPKR